MNDSLESSVQRGVRAAQTGLTINVVLVIVKITSGILGTSYALIADGLESSADILSSLIVWGGLRYAARPADADHHFGHGKAEPIAGVIVSLMLLLAAAGIAFLAVAEIRIPHRVPAPFTLVVAGGVIVIKRWLFRRTQLVGDEVDSSAVKADAAHHRSDAISSTAAFIGIGIAIIGSRLWTSPAGPRWESADDWAALVAAGVVAANGILMLRATVEDLMDRAPAAEVLNRVRLAAAAVPGVRRVEKVRARRSGLGYFVELHVHADQAMSLRDAHALGGRCAAHSRPANQAFWMRSFTWSPTSNDGASP